MYSFLFVFFLFFSFFLYNLNNTNLWSVQSLNVRTTCRTWKMIIYLKFLSKGGWFDIVKSNILAFLFFDPIINLWALYMRLFWNTLFENAQRCHRLFFLRQDMSKSQKQLEITNCNAIQISTPRKFSFSGAIQIYITSDEVVCIEIQIIWKCPDFNDTTSKGIYAST